MKRSSERPLTVAVCGGIGSGKSTVCGFLAEKGIPIYDSDSRTKEIYRSDESLVEALEAALSANLRDSNGCLDTTALARLIFSDRSRLGIVEEIVHPKVKEDFIKWRDEQGDVPFVVMESAIVMQKPLFFDLFDCYIVVQAPESVRTERVILRDSSSSEEVNRRIANQQGPLRGSSPTDSNDNLPKRSPLLDGAAGLNLSDALFQRTFEGVPLFEIKNDGTLEELRRKTNNLFYYIFSA